MTRVGYFRKVLVRDFLKKVAQRFGYFGGYCEKLATFCKNELIFIPKSVHTTKIVLTAFYPFGLAVTLVKW